MERPPHRRQPQPFRSGGWRDCPPEGERHVTSSGVPGAVVLHPIHGQEGLNLVAGPDAALVDAFVAHRGGVAARDRARVDDFVLRERLLGEEGARQIELAGRPGAFGAEVPDVSLLGARRSDVASPVSASWNQLKGWLCAVDALRQAA